MRLDEQFFLVSSGPKSLYFSLGKLIFPVTGFSTFVYLKVKLRSNNGSPERDPEARSARSWVTRVSISRY